MTDQDIAVGFGKGESGGVVVLCAMLGEAAPIIARLGLEPAEVPWDVRLPMGLWRHPVDEVALVTNGVDAKTGADLIGTTPACLAASMVCEYLRPRVLLVAGAAGGKAGATEIGRVHLIDRAFHHDRRIPLPEFAAYAHGPERLFVSEELGEACGATVATISTGNALDTMDGELVFFDTHGVTVKDMETAAIAWVAAQYGVRVVALRAITDYFDHASPADQFLANFGLAVGNLAVAVERGVRVLLEA
jgi:nucleoside phosphorylase